MFGSANLISSPIPVFWNKLDGAMSIFYNYPNDSSNPNIHLDSIISLPLELYNPNNTLDSSFEYLIQTNYLTTLPQKLANVWKMIGWCYQKTHIVESGLMRNINTVIQLKSKLIEKTNKAKAEFFLNAYQEIIIDTPNSEDKIHPFTLLPYELVNSVIYKLTDPHAQPNVENKFIPNTSFLYKYPRKPKPLVHSTPQTITFGSSISPSLQTTLQNIQSSLITQSATPMEVSTTTQSSESNYGDEDAESSPLHPSLSAHT